MQPAKKLRVIPFRAAGDVQKGIDAYLKYLLLRCRAGGIVKATFDAAAWYLGSFGSMFGPRSFDDCRSTDLVEWLLAHPEWDSPHTKNDAIKQVVGCFKWCDDEAICKRRLYKFPKGLWDALLPRTAMKPDEYRTIMDLVRASDGIPRNGKRRHRCPGRVPFMAALFFLWECGARTCEMRVADVEDYDQQANEIRLPPKKHKTGKKTGKPRIIPLGRAGRLVRWLCHGRSDGPIFRNSRKRRWSKSTFAKMFRRFSDKAGVRKEVSAYCCRHGFTCRAKEKGVDSLQVAHVLGQTTARYVESVYGRSLLEKSDYLADVAARINGPGKP